MKPAGRKHYKEGTKILQRRYISVSLLVNSLKNNERICFNRFGCFEKRTIAGRKFKHKNGKMCEQKPYFKIHFSPSMPFKKAINQ